jgi:hypothetical protein
MHRAKRKHRAAVASGCCFLELLLCGGGRSEAAAAIDHLFRKHNLNPG